MSCPLKLFIEIFVSLVITACACGNSSSNSRNGINSHVSMHYRDCQNELNHAVSVIWALDGEYELVLIAV